MADITKINEIYFKSMSGLMKTGAAEVSSFVRSGETPPAPPAGGDRGVFGPREGNSSLEANIIDYITISTTGNATNFGDAIIGRWGSGGCSNGVNDRGIFAGGYDGEDGYNSIEYITILSAGNAANFGDLMLGRCITAGLSNGANDRGLFTGRYPKDSRSDSNSIEYITISSNGNGTNFGDLLQNNDAMGTCSNATNNRGIIAGGGYDESIDVIQYITISTPGNAQDFGDLTIGKAYFAGCSNGTNDRGVFGSGKATWNDIIDYITISTTGNATNFGALTGYKYSASSCSNGINDRGIFGGGYTINGNINNIDYITIPTPGNAQDFGDLSAACYSLASISNA